MATWNLLNTNKGMCQCFVCQRSSIYIHPSELEKQHQGLFWVGSVSKTSQSIFAKDLGPCQRLGLFV